MVPAYFYLFKSLELKRACIPMLLLPVLLVGVSACSTAAPVPGLTPVTVQLSWTHQVEFAGFYAAEQQGYFRDEGLKVTFLEGGPEVDFIGRKVRTALTIDQTLQAIMAKEGITQEQYEPVYLSSETGQFASGDVLVWGRSINVFVVEVQKAGYKVNIISPDDYGIHFSGDTLITTDSLIRNNPDLVQRFLRASLMGWTYALENPEAAGTYVGKYTPNVNGDLEADKMIASIPLINTGEDHIGWMKHETWDALVQTLRAQEDLKQPLQVDDVYTMQFLEEMYGK
jgi:ABC-type nitrate/sulfonate/bicarbonate transport system substrate-binding protein